MTNFSLIVVGDSVWLDPSLDRITPLVRGILKERGYKLLHVTFSPNSIHELRKSLYSIPEETEVILVCGGTGLSHRDVSIEAIKPLMDKELRGFGELFRSLSIEDIGLRAILSRSTAGSIGGRAIFILPGSPNAVRLALEKIILPQLDHMLDMLRGVTHWRMNYIRTSTDAPLVDSSFILRYTLGRLKNVESFMLIRVKKEILEGKLEDLRKSMKPLLTIESPNYVLLVLEIKESTRVNEVLSAL